MVPIIDIPGLGDRAAETVCVKLGIKNQHDAKNLEEAKKQVCFMMASSSEYRRIHR